MTVDSMGSDCHYFRVAAVSVATSILDVSSLDLGRAFSTAPFFAHYTMGWKFLFSFLNPPGMETAVARQSFIQQQPFQQLQRVQRNISAQQSCLQGPVQGWSAGLQAILRNRKV